METLPNIYDGPKKQHRIIKHSQFQLDFAYSQDAGVLDTGIRETIRGVKLSIMAMGIALYRVDVGGLYADLGFRKFGEYIDSLVKETGMSRSNLYNWEYIGQAYITHRSELDKIGFTDDDGPTKLPFLNRALERHPKREVYKNIKNMSRREFEEWSRGAIIEDGKKHKTVAIKKGGVFAGKEPLAVFSEEISLQDRRYYEKLLMEGAIAIKQNEYAGIYRFYDEAEKKRFDRIYQRELGKLRTKN